MEKLIEHKSKNDSPKWTEQLTTYVKYVKSQDYWFSLCALTLVALVTRMSYLDHPPGCIWDEVHFGKFASHYINRDYYFDVHPPLGKIIIAGACYMSGYQGQFNFSLGSIYDESFNYHVVRMEMSLFGALLIPLAFLTVYELSSSVGAATIGAIAILSDTYVHRLNTLILLDPLLNFTIAFAVFCVVRFHNMRRREWSLQWWLWLCLTGVGLGVVMSIKYVGVFTVLFVGVHTIYQLMYMCCDKDTPPWEVIPHFLARALCLIILPIMVYISAFALHFLILSNSTHLGGSWMHSRYFAHFNNTEFNNATFPKYVNYGANVTLQTSSPNLGYLDTWFDLFPSELTAPCQIMSTMPIRDDEGSEWRMRKVNLETGQVNDAMLPTEPPMLVRNGDHIMLTNPTTGRSMRSHSRRAPYTRSLFQVCAYGDNGSGGPFETWKVIVPGVPEGEPLRVFEHDFYLRHYKMNCYLKATQEPLPDSWASGGSKEIACTKNQNHPNTLWHINWITSDKVVGETRLKDHAMSFWERLFHIHHSMLDMNANLGHKEVDKNKRDDLEDEIGTSRPWKWPICYQNQLMAGYHRNESVGLMAEYTYSVGSFNPVVAYVNLLTFVGVVVVFIQHCFAVSRGGVEDEERTARRVTMLSSSMWLLICWGLHYLPFFFMWRTLYLHHYVPSYMYSCMLTGVLINYLADLASEWLGSLLPKCKSNIKFYLLFFPAMIFIVSYIILFPIATYVEHSMFERNERISLVLDRFYVGQQWYEFGYNPDIFIIVNEQQMIPLEEENFENLDLNVTLYYLTDLNFTRPEEEEYKSIQISPVSVTNFTQWIEETSRETPVNDVIPVDDAVSSQEADGDVISDDKPVDDVDSSQKSVDDVNNLSVSSVTLGTSVTKDK